MMLAYFSLMIYHQAVDAGYLGRNHPKVATRLNNIAAVLESKGDYAGALAKYGEALKIFEAFLGPDHPNTQTVRANRDQAWWASLSEQEQWFLRTQSYRSQLKDSSSEKAENEQLALLNQIGVGYIKQIKGDSALMYLNPALPLAKKLADQEMVGTILNNLGSAHKVLKNWGQAESYLRQSIQHNTAVSGDSAAILAYSYFHLGAVCQAQSQPDSARFYAQKSQAIAKKHALTDLLEDIQALLSSIGEIKK